MADISFKNLKEGLRPRKSNSKDVELSVFDILNIFHCHWFLLRTNLLTNVILAQKAEDGKISWIKFTPQFHSHLVKCAVALVPHPIYKVKKVMFGYILELLNREGHMAFFKLQKGSHKANNAQKEKRCLAWKWSHAAKHERDREAVKVAKQPPCEQQCVACGQKFNSCKTASKHKCPKSKVERVRKKAASSQASQAITATMTNMPPATPTSHAPTAPSNSNATPVVTEGS